MEGSVKSLIEAEQRAREVVEQAERDMNSKIDAAQTIANQMLNKQKQQFADEIAKEEKTVSNL